MWRLKQLMPKDQAGLEGKTIDVGSLKLQVRSTIAEGGFSCVYLAKDAQSGKQYALKHIICNDTESLDLVKKEVAVMKVLRGHPNIVTLHTQAMYDMGRTKECFLVMDYCDKVLVSVLDGRGAGYFEEKQLLLMFRDICNAVYAMHCQSPPIAHRDLKAENVLMGAEGHWKLCDFGSTSTNHKRFERADEMGVEEDVIRKHTTPAYRAPEMWDLYRRELISEKVDIWALGCLLYRMAYLKSAFDGESKLQILNGNYRIPDLPKFNGSVTGLIKDMLSANPEARPDVLQVWRRVNDFLPPESRKTGPDNPPATRKSPSQNQDILDSSNASRSKHSPVMPSRAPPLPPQRDMEHRFSPPAPREAERRSPPPVSREPDRHSSHGAGGNAPAGSFWSTKFAQTVQYKDASLPVDDKAGGNGSPSIQTLKSPDTHATSVCNSPPKEHHSAAGHFFSKRGVTDLKKKVHDSLYDTGSREREGSVADGCELRLDDEEEGKDEVALSEPSDVVSVNETVHPSSNATFSAFVADFQSSMSYTPENQYKGKESLQTDLERLKEELMQVTKEKTELASKYEKLTAICRSQRHEIQQLKSALQAANNQTAVSISKETIPQTLSQPLQPSWVHVPHQQKQGPPGSGSWQTAHKQSEKQVGSIRDLQEVLPLYSSQGYLASETQAWQELGSFSASQVSPKYSTFSINSPVHGSGRMSDSVDSPRSNSPRGGVTNGHGRQQHARAATIAGSDNRGFVQDTFSTLGNTFQASKGAGHASSQADLPIGSTSARESSNSKGEVWGSRQTDRSQPAGWAGF